MTPAKKSRSKSNPAPVSSARTRAVVSKTSFFDQIEVFLAKQQDRIFWISFVLSIIFGALLFDIRFSLSGDDSAYVVRAYDFIHHFIFPGFLGPLYPVVLSPFVAVFGLSAIPLKFVSLLFILGFLYFFHLAFRNRIPAVLHSSMLILLSVNSFILYYGSQTYSEAFFMFLQAVTFILFFTFFIGNRERKAVTNLALHHLLLGCCLVGLGITRSISFSAVVAVMAYFILKLEWKNLVFSAASFIYGIVFIPACKVPAFRPFDNSV
jgi:hypothetical protein